MQKLNNVEPVTNLGFVISAFCAGVGAMVGMAVGVRVSRSIGAVKSA